jgi:transposase-like protein
MTFTPTNDRSTPQTDRSTGYEPHQAPPGGTGNARNGTTPKTLVTEHEPVAINAPRDRNVSFDQARAQGPAPL